MADFKKRQTKPDLSEENRHESRHNNPRSMSKKIALEKGKYGCRAVLKTCWNDQFIDYFLMHKVVELELNIGHGWTGQDLSFLAKLPSLLAFDIFSFGISSIDPIHQLGQLKRLGVTTYCSTEIDFSAFPKLESCDLEWRIKANSLFNCSTLKELSLIHYKGHDLQDFAKLTNLESLQILTAPLKNLNGASTLKKLRYLRLGNLKNLVEIEGIKELENLEELDINSCRKISSISELGFLTNLKKLHLTNLGNIDSLNPLKTINGLNTVTFSESTNILDGDLSPLLRNPKLAIVAFMERRHYSHSRLDFDS